MRITAGYAKGRVFKTPDGQSTRPTDSRTRETLFNIVGERIVEARVLDLYAGSGALGLESLSRGASWCHFVEQNPAACRIIRDNIQTLNFDENAIVWQTNIKSAVGRLLELQARKDSEKEAEAAVSEPHPSSFIFHPFDVVLADPPFHRKTELPQLCALLDNLAPLLHNGKEPSSPLPLLVLQTAWRDEPHLSPNFVRINERRAGESRLSFYEVHNPNSK